jgi:hypothetical protein
MEVLESITRLATLPHWQRLKDEALKKLEGQERTVSHLVFKTRSAIDPIEIEYFRGFRQGVMYVLEGLPNGAQLELERRLKQFEEENKEVR